MDVRPVRPARGPAAAAASTSCSTARRRSWPVARRKGKRRRRRRRRKAPRPQHAESGHVAGLAAVTCGATAIGGLVVSAATARRSRPGLPGSRAGLGYGRARRRCRPSLGRTARSTGFFCVGFDWLFFGRPILTGQTDGRPVPAPPASWAGWAGQPLSEHCPLSPGSAPYPSRRDETPRGEEVREGGLQRRAGPARPAAALREDSDEPGGTGTGARPVPATVVRDSVRPCRTELRRSG